MQITSYLVLTFVFFCFSLNAENRSHSDSSRTSKRSTIHPYEHLKNQFDSALEATLKKKHFTKNFKIPRHYSGECFTAFSSGLSVEDAKKNVQYSDLYTFYDAKTGKKSFTMSGFSSSKFNRSSEDKEGLNEDYQRAVCNKMKIVTSQEQKTNLISLTSTPKRGGSFVEGVTVSQDGKALLYKVGEGKEANYCRFPLDESEAL